MIKVLIIEDEEAASKRLQKMLTDLLPEIKPLNSIVSVVSAIEWLKNNPQPDLIIADIHLADGSSFEIFKEVKVECPIIFTTAFDQYAIEAFKLNSIDYLLKPVKKEELKVALEKFNKIYKSKDSAATVDFQKLFSSLQLSQTNYKERFVIKFGEHLKTILTDDIAYFYTENRANFAVMKDAKRNPVDFNLDELESVLDPKKFFRINRQFIISFSSIAQMHSYSKARVLIKLDPPTKLDTIVSTERAADFKLWLAGEV